MLASTASRLTATIDGTPYEADVRWAPGEAVMHLAEKVRRKRDPDRARRRRLSPEPGRHPDPRLGAPAGRG